jgi:pyruvate/2-oxoglutarate dehydrogenase complex dihydrolipoamide dehydrogenase (E3) component
VAIGNQASEVINLAILAIQSGIGTRDIERLTLIHPSASVALSALRYEVSKKVDAIEGVASGR